MELKANTLEPHWMPFTANRDFKADPRLIVKGEGIYFWNHKGERLIDGSSGLFCCAAGHGRKEIAEAVYKQLLEMDYTAPFQLGHPWAFELAGRVAQLTPGDLNHVFFGNSGSEAIDTALKIAMAYHRAKGESHRVRYVSRERAYHGVNIGGTSLSGLMKNREVFGQVMPGVAHMRHTWLAENRFVRGQPDTGAELAEDLQRLCELYGGHTISACFVEPIAGSTGILVPPKGYLERLREICDAHGILLVFDEVICGFGRTGKAFAAQSFDVLPDIMTLAKAITNGNQPMGAVAVRDPIYDAVVDAAPEAAIELFHGYTYSGHPAACAAGLATLDIFEKDKLFDKAAALSEPFLNAAFALRDIPLVTDIRGYGLIAGFDVAPGSMPGGRGIHVQKKLYNAGVHIKFTGDCGIVAPPFIATPADIEEIFGIIRDVLKDEK
ncbi:MAG: aminotransferase class III-fold pyridoxal phosphate-dependent enzyme [Rhodospirillales bacterium]